MNNVWRQPFAHLSLAALFHVRVLRPIRSNFLFLGPNRPRWQAQRLCSFPPILLGLNCRHEYSFISILTLGNTSFETTMLNRIFGCTRLIESERCRSSVCNLTLAAVSLSRLFSTISCCKQKARHKKLLSAKIPFLLGFYRFPRILIDLECTIFRH